MYTDLCAVLAKWPAKKAKEKALLWYVELINCRLKLILYQPGARGDFVCGWAGLLQNVINNQWTIDPTTGLSSGHFATKALEHGRNLDEVLLEENLVLDANSDLFYVAPCHGTDLEIDSFKDLVDAGLMQLYAIDVTNADLATVAWEMIVKSFLSHRNTTWHETAHKSWTIDSQIDLPWSEITDQHRVDTLKPRTQKKVYLPAVEKFLNSPGVTVLDYTKLFVTGGSHYFCDRLGLDAPEVCHEFWNQMLKFATSPDSITVWNYTWNKEDFCKSKDSINSKDSCVTLPKQHMKLHAIS